MGEFSVSLGDAVHGKGRAQMMTASVLVHCLSEGLAVLDVHILSENAAAKRLVKSLDADWTGESVGVAEYRLDVAAAIAALRAGTDVQGVQDVLRALEGGGKSSA